MEFLKHLILMILVCVNTVELNENCDQLGVLFYEDIACKPIRVSDNPCPYKFDCNVGSSYDSGCMFKGKYYAVDEKISQDLTSDGCRTECYCTKFNNISCKIEQCKEFQQNNDEQLEPDCHYGYHVDSCCSNGEVCDNKKVCEVDGSTYKIGQKFLPKNTCLNCVCQANFDGNFNNINTCKRRNCVIQTRDFSSKIKKYCAPIYLIFGNDNSERALCCPSEFLCPDASEQFEVFNPNPNIPSSEENLQCNYGTQKVKVGHGFRRTTDVHNKERFLHCQCVLPPFMTCKEVF